MPLSIIIGIAGAILLIFIVVLLIYPGKRCPVCGYRLPKFRPGQNDRERLYGGWTCPNCSSEIDTLGNIIMTAEEKKAIHLNSEQREKILAQMEQRFTTISNEELSEILKHNNQKDWTDDAIEAIRRVLRGRGIKIDFRK
jgi:hypothetical protein